MAKINSKIDKVLRKDVIENGVFLGTVLIFGFNDNIYLYENEVYVEQFKLTDDDYVVTDFYQTTWGMTNTNIYNGKFNANEPYAEELIIYMSLYNESLYLSNKKYREIAKQKFDELKKDYQESGLLDDINALLKKSKSKTFRYSKYESEKNVGESIKESSNVKDSELREWIDLAIKEFKSMIKDRQKLILKGCKEGYEYGKELLDDYIHNTQGLDDLISQIRNCVKKYSIDYNFYYYLSAYGAFSSNWNLWDKLTDELYESKKNVRKSIKESSYFDLVKAKKEGYDDYKHRNVGNPYKKGTDLYDAYWFGVERAENESSGKTHTTFSDEEFDSIFGGKMCRKSIKESRESILDKRFYELIDEGYIYDEDENGMNMSYGEYVAVSDDLWETLENELEYYRDFPSAYDAYNEIMDNTSDDAKMFMGVSDDDYFYFEINEDENTYSFSGEVPTVLEKLFKKFLKETDFERV